MNAQEGAWIGWPGDVSEDLDVRSSNDGMTLVPVSMSAEEYEEYYEGFSNATLWPLYHDVVAKPEFHREWWDAYVTVNQRFAEAAAEDRRRGRDGLDPGLPAPAGPGPAARAPPGPADRLLPAHPVPARRAVLARCRGAASCSRACSAPTWSGSSSPVRPRTSSGWSDSGSATRPTATRSTSPTDGWSPRRRSRSRSTPPASRRSPAPSRCRHAPRRSARTSATRDKIFLGIDRLDYTKGIYARLRAFSELIDDGHFTVEDATFVQVASPSRERVDQYRILRDDIDRLVGHINGDLGRIGRPAISYLNASFPQAEMAALYVASDIMVVTPFRDGMNLVAKEYVACRFEDDGALVLSEFAGAAEELKQAYLVNPYDINGMKAQMLDAYQAEPKELARRMKAMRRTVAENDVENWANAFLDDLAAARPGHAKQVKPAKRS